MISTWVSTRTAGVRSWPRPRAAAPALPGCRARPVAAHPAAPSRSPGSELQRDKDGTKRPGGAGGNCRGWPRAQPPARPARRSRPAPSAPAGALTPILLRKHLLSFKVTPPPFRRGENKPAHHHSTLQAGRGKKYPKSRGPYVGKKKTTGRRGAACVHCAPAFLPSPGNTETSWPAAHLL